jgi:hypothetical protein
VSSYHVVNPIFNPVLARNIEIEPIVHIASNRGLPFGNDAGGATCVPNVLSSINYSLLAQAQSTCPDVALMRQSSNLTVVPRPVEGETLLGDVSTGVFRPLLPHAFRNEAI